VAQLVVLASTVKGVGSDEGLEGLQMSLVELREPSVLQGLLVEGTPHLLEVPLIDDVLSGGRLRGLSPQ